MDIETFKDEYEEYAQQKTFGSLPIEYYSFRWVDFGRHDIRTHNIEQKSAFVDSSGFKNYGGSETYISRIVRDLLSPTEQVRVALAHRRIKEAFSTDVAVASVNDKLGLTESLTGRQVSIAVDTDTRTAWEKSIVTHLSGIPIQNLGKGTQTIVGLELALDDSCEKSKVILLEEPENHLSHSNLNKLLQKVCDRHQDQQIIVTTHSSFVANKLGLDHLILLNDLKTSRLENLESDTKEFFEKISGYDTLRFLLCEKAILVEGDSDELVVQKAFMDKHQGKLPIQCGIEVISVGTSFLRFLEVANEIKQSVVVVTDNDGDIAALEEKYGNYLGANVKDHVRISYSKKTLTGDDAKTNYNTLEPELFDAAGTGTLNTIFNKEYTDRESMLKYMKGNKTQCALDIFESATAITYPEYILEAIQDE